jgi:hypothetical protein
MSSTAPKSALKGTLHTVCWWTLAAPVGSLAVTLDLVVSFLHFLSWVFVCCFIVEL